MLSRPVSGGRLRPLPLLSKSAPLLPPQQRTIIGPREDSLQSMRDTRALLSYRSGPARGLNEILREKKKERAVSPARRVRQVLAPVVCVKFWQTETGFEPATPRSEVWCSNPLSYTAFLEGLPLKKKWKTKFDNNKLRRYKSFGWKDTGKLTSLLKRVSLNSATRSGLVSLSLHCTHGTARAKGLRPSRRLPAPRWSRGPSLVVAATGPSHRGIDDDGALRIARRPDAPPRPGPGPGRPRRRRRGTRGTGVFPSRRPRSWIPRVDEASESSTLASAPPSRSPRRRTGRIPRRPASSSPWATSPGSTVSPDPPTRRRPRSADSLPSRPISPLPLSLSSRSSSPAPPRCQQGRVRAL